MYWKAKSQPDGVWEGNNSLRPPSAAKGSAIGSIWPMRWAEVSGQRSEIIAGSWEMGVGHKMLPENLLCGVGNPSLESQHRLCRRMGEAALGLGVRFRAVRGRSAMPVAVSGRPRDGQRKAQARRMKKADPPRRSGSAYTESTLKHRLWSDQTQIHSA
jgi:hypothetical protein